jgi:predicted RNase H-like HicB family nuclease
MLYTKLDTDTELCQNRISLIKKAGESRVNKKRRDELSAGLNLLENAIEEFDSIKEKVAQHLNVFEDARNDEQDYFDNMPSSFQDGEKGEAAQEAIDSLQEAIDLVSEFLGTEINYQEIDELVCRAMD